MPGLYIPIRNNLCKQCEYPAAQDRAHDRRHLVFPACLALALLGSALLYLYMTLLLLLPVLVVFFIVRLIRFGLRPTRKSRLADLLVAICLIGIWVGFVRVGDNFGDVVRWSIWSESYKRTVNFQPAALVDSLDPNPRHILWRVWGGLGMDNEADLVFDRSGALAQTAAETVKQKKVIYGCEVVDVRQLEPDWFIVTLFTNAGWPGC